MVRVGVRWLLCVAVGKGRRTGVLAQQGVRQREGSGAASHWNTHQELVQKGCMPSCFTEPG